MWSFELTQDEDFNLHGAFAILELMGEIDVAEKLREGDWRVMPRAYQALRKGVINTADEDLLEESEQHVQEYYSLLGRYLGVFPRDVDDVPTVLQNLHRHVTESTKKVLSDFLRVFLADNGSGYMEFLNAVSKLDISDDSQNHSYMIYALMECSRVVIDGMNLEINDDNDQYDNDLPYGSDNDE